MTTDVLGTILTLLREAKDGASIGVAPSVLVTGVREAAPEIHAFRHPLGFLHIELTSLVDAGPGERLRLHIWPNVHYGGDAAGNIHDHTWALASLVVMGALRDCNFRPIAAVDGRYAARRVKYGHPNTFEPAGKYDLEKVADRLVGPGTVYTIPARLVHETIVLQAPTVTIVRAQEDGNARGPLLLQSGEDVSIGTPERERLSRHEIRRVLDDLLMHLR